MLQGIALGIAIGYGIYHFFDEGSRNYEEEIYTKGYERGYEEGYVEGRLEKI
ncbi:MAG: hypothetical protein ACOCZ5_00495 [bacterium]